MLGIGLLNPKVACVVGFLVPEKYLSSSTLKILLGIIPPSLKKGILSPSG